MTGPGRGPRFTKRDPGAPPGLFAAEAAGLAFLAEAGAVRLPAVLAVEPDAIVTARIPVGAASRDGAEELGRQLADLHACAPPAFGAPWAGFIGPLPLDNGSAEDWPSFYVERRVRPYLRQAADRGALDPIQAVGIERALDRLPARAGPPEPPARIHGDLWSGNVVWDRAGAAWLVDPAAHGGHRETDLAMLALFGAPHLDRLLAAYHEHRPLAEGWQERVLLHQLHPLLVHAVLFGAPYGERAAAAARRL